jgi:GWxTD domain-containing protein
MLPAQDRRAAQCLDPARPILEVAATYDGWPVPRAGRSTRAFKLLQAYLRSGDFHDYHLALHEYESLGDVYPSDSHVVLALGVLYSTGPDLNFPGMNGYRHNSVAAESNADEKAARYLTRAVESNPSQWLAAVALTRLALVSPEPKRVPLAHRVVRLALAADSANVTLRLADYDLLVREEEFGAALAAAETIHPECPAALHAKAEAHILTLDVERGVNLYFEGLRNAGPEDLHRYFDDIRMIATRRQLEAYLRTPAPARSDWISAFWRRSAATSARTVEDRLVTQIQRAAHADAHFRSVESKISTGKSVGWIADTSHVVPWDIRGVIYTRHGKPVEEYYAQDNDQVYRYEYSAWVYPDADSTFVVLFVHRMYSAGDWLPTGPSCPGRLGNLGRLRSERQIRDALANGETIHSREMFVLLRRYDRRFADLARFCTQGGAGGFWSKLTDLRRKMAFESARRFDALKWTESSRRVFVKPVRILVADYEFRGEDNKPELAVVMWLPAVDALPAHEEAGSLKMTFAIVDSINTTLRIDTLVPMANPTDTTAVIRSSVLWRDIRLRNGTVHVSVRNANDSTQGGTRSRNVAIRADTSALSLSDIVLAEPDKRGILVRGDHRISPLASNTIGRGEPFRVFYELYGVNEGDLVDTSIRVRPAKSPGLVAKLLGKTNFRELRYSDRAEIDRKGITVRDVVVGGDLAPGAYIVEVRIKANGRETTNSTPLYVEELAHFR